MLDLRLSEYLMLISEPEAWFLIVLIAFMPDAGEVVDALSPRMWMWYHSKIELSLARRFDETILG